MVPSIGRAINTNINLRSHETAHSCALRELRMAFLRLNHTDGMFTSTMTIHIAAVVGLTGIVHSLSIKLNTFVSVLVTYLDEKLLTVSRDTNDIRDCS